MKTFNINELSKRALEFMRSEGASENRLEKYQTIGFGAIVRAFGETHASCEDLETFLHKQRELYERGCFSKTKWGLIRRSVELLKFFAETGTLDMPRLPEWNFVHSPLQSKPSVEQLADTDNVHGLVWRTRQALAATGLSKGTLDYYDYDGFNKILNVHIDSGQSRYSNELSRELVFKTYDQYRVGNLSKGRFEYLRRTVSIVEKFRETGAIVTDKMTHWGQRELTPEFSRLLEQFSVDADIAARWSKKTLTVGKYAIKRFLFQLENRGLSSFDRVSLRTISETITESASQYTGGLGSFITKVRSFLNYLHVSGHTLTDLSVAVPEYVSPRRHYRKGFSAEDIRKLLSVPDTSTHIGKRNYAIMVLAVQTGLRAVDIVNLKHSNINWTTREIRIVQHKTGKPLALPFEPESSNAIADYLLNARPKCSAPNIFVSHSGIPVPLSGNSLSLFVGKYVKLAGIDNVTATGRGFHSFRRAFGTILLETETSLELLQQMTGHFHIDSVIPYLSLEEQGLKSCALPLIDIGKDGVRHEQEDI